MVRLHLSFFKQLIRITLISSILSFSWAHPAKHYTITKLKERTSVVEFTYKLLMYERDIKVMLTIIGQFIEITSSKTIF